MHIVIGRFGAASDGADHHVFSDLEVIRAVIGHGLEHPAATNTDRPAAAGCLELLQHVRTLLVGTDQG